MFQKKPKAQIPPQNHTKNRKLVWWIYVKKELGQS